MKRSAALIALTLVTVATMWVMPATAADDDPGSMMLVLDSSGSMKEKASDGMTKIDAAKKSLNTVIDDLPAKQAVGLRVYGAKVFSADDKGACTDSQSTDLARPISRQGPRFRIDLLPDQANPSLDRRSTSG